MSGWLNDESSNSHVATPTAVATGAAPTYSTSVKKFGSSSAKFVRTSNLAGGYLSIPDSSAFTLPTTWSMNFWIYPTSLGSTHQGLFGNWRDQAIDTGWKVFFDDNDARVRGRWSWGLNANSWTWVTSDGQYLIPNNTWTHIAVSRDTPAQRWRLWINGILAWIRNFDDGRGGAGARDSSRSFYIGAQDDLIGGDGPRYFFDGYIDALHIENGVSNWAGDDSTEGTKYFSPENYTEGPTATAYTSLLMNFNETLYEVAGTLSHDSRIMVVDEGGRTVENDSVETAGAYSVTVNDADPKSVIAIRESDGKILGYGRVTPSIV